MKYRMVIEGKDGKCNVGYFDNLKFAKRLAEVLKKTVGINSIGIYLDTPEAVIQEFVWERSEVK
jgi:hypothetical protein